MFARQSQFYLVLRLIISQYGEIRHYLNEACSDISKLSLFTTKILAK